MTPVEVAFLLNRLLDQFDKRGLLEPDQPEDEVFAAIADVVRADKEVADDFLRLRSAPVELVYSATELHFPGVDLSDPYLASKAADRLPRDASAFDQVEAVRGVAEELLPFSFPTIRAELRLSLVAKAVFFVEVDEGPSGFSL